MGESHEAVVATMQSDIGYLKNDVHEIKNDIKEQGRKLDELARNWQEFGGLAKLIADQNERLGKMERKTESNSVKIWIAYGGLIVLGVLVVPIFVNVISAYFTNKIH